MEAHVVSVAQRSMPRLVRDRRWWLLLLAAWAAAVVFSLSSQAMQIRRQTTAIAIEGARNMFRMVLLTRNWNASHGGIYVPVTERTQPNPYLDVPFRDVTTTDGLELTMVNPAYMTRLIAEMAESASGAVFRLTSLRPIRPENAADAWEGQALQAFERGIKEASGVENGPDGEMLRYMAPLAVQESCLQCHRKQGYKVGDIRGGISVSQRNAPIEAAVQAAVGEARLLHAVAFVLIAVAGWLLLELLRRRWSELSGKIQELQDTQSQLLQSEKMAGIGQLAAGVAHEINNPVGFVTSNLGTLQKYSAQMIGLLERCRAGKASEADFVAADFDFLKEDLAELLRESQAGLGRVTRIVANLRNFSHVDAAEQQLADLNGELEATLNVLGHEFAGKAEIVRELGELPAVACNAAEIDLVLMNLLLNAAHAIAGRGTITVRSGCAEGGVWIEVADDGSGMTPAVMLRIFEPFYTTRPVGKGAGLGLSQSYEIVRRHGGRIEVRSEPGQGSCFRVWLPLVNETGNTAPDAA